MSFFFDPLRHFRSKPEIIRLRLDKANIRYFVNQAHVIRLNELKNENLFDPLGKPPNRLFEGSERLK